MERSKKALPSDQAPADPDIHVVFPMADTASKVKELLRERKVVFIRSGVGNGKTTLAHYLAKDERFHLVDFPTEAVRVDTYDAVTSATRTLLQLFAAVSQNADTA